MSTAARVGLVFFPYSLLVKTPLSLFAVLAIAVVVTLIRWRNETKNREEDIHFVSRLGQGIYQTAPLWVFLLVYWLMAIRSSINIGHRHVLATYPILFILAGSAAIGRGKHYRVLSILTLLSVVGLIVESFSVRPHYLAYFNALAGGPRQGYRHLVDSSLDWGQDLPSLKRWLDTHLPTTNDRPVVYLSYFGTGDPQHYGVEAQRLPHYPDWRPAGGPRHLDGGIYCISATMLQSVYGPAWGRWTNSYEKEYQRLTAQFDQQEKSQIGDASGEQLDQRNQGNDWSADFDRYEWLRFAKLCAYLRGRQPDDHVGYSILIYHLKDKQIEEALSGQVPDTNLSCGSKCSDTVAPSS